MVLMTGALDYLKWPSLARDLAVMTVPDSPLEDLDKVLTTYNLSREELAKLVLHPEFQPLFQKELELCRSQGTRAGQIYRFSTLSQALSEKLFQDAMGLGENGMKAAEAIKLLELMMKAAGLADTKDTPVVNVQTNVGVQLPLPTGLSNPKLKHLEATDVSV